MAQVLRDRLPLHSRAETSRCAQVQGGPQLALVCAPLPEHQGPAGTHSGMQDAAHQRVKDFEK